MIYLAHRGFWLSSEEKNQRSAFERAWQGSFGLEIDVRDSRQRLVISHDMPSGNELAFDDFLSLYTTQGNHSWLAINIKADGLASSLQQSLSQHGVQHYFVFDTSIPEFLQYQRRDMPIAMRLSEFEQEAVFLEKSCFVWLDCFHRMWFDENRLRSLLDAGKTVAIVSPELHGRPHLGDWQFLKKGGFHHHERVMLCTDHPEKARIFFNE